MDEARPRPSADELLARVKAEEAQKKRGKLKIFLGYAAGVGKTYTMLEAARELRKSMDIVVAIVETHGRTETEALLEGFEVMPRKQVEYRGITLTEMDIDAVLARKPQLALVDELAHENAPDSRHPKRYQDIEELLDAGIDVYTTLNVQHVESVRGAVAQVTGVWVRETVPDAFIDSASEVELVDLPPDELLKRLKEGKVYIPKQVAWATEQFFRKGNLIALRELALRVVARHVDEQTLSYMRTHAIEGLWPSGERLLVCVGPGVGGHLVRSARRLAHQLGADWFAIYVETQESARLRQEDQEQLSDTLRLAERLGAKTSTIQAASVVRGVTEFARKNNITKIVVGRSRRKWFQKLFRRSAADEILGHSEYFDVYLVSAGGEPPEKRERRLAPPTFGDWQGYLQGLALVVAATLAGELYPGFFSQANLIMVYLLCVVVTAFFWGFGPSIMTSLLGVVVFKLLFVQPFFSLNVSDTKYVLTFIVLLGVGVSISYLMRMIRRQTEAATGRERQTAALYSLGRDLAVANDLESYVRAIRKSVKETFGRESVVYLATRDKQILKPYTGDGTPGVDANEFAAAVWSFQHQRAVGRGTDTLPNAKARYLPLMTARGAVGVLAVLANYSGAGLTHEQERVLKAYADLSAVALESTLLNEEAHNTQVLRNTEKLQAALLNSVSQDLRTPLATIIGAMSNLQEKGTQLDDVSKGNLVQVAREEAERLNHLITNLLDVSRIEAGAIRMSVQPSEVQDLVEAALEEVGSRARGRKVNVDLPAKLPLVSADFGLIVQTLANVLDNALKYSSADAPVDISARQSGQEVNIEVADRGLGIPPEDLLKVFDKFYRIEKRGSLDGAGLGLSICKGIIEAHGGHIAAQNRPGGGTIIRLALPVAQAQPKEARPVDA